jgi:hypothetical protein
MKVMKPLINVDFNEMIEDDLVLLSKSDIKEDHEGNLIELREGLIIRVFEEDVNDENQIINLVAEGVIEKNISKNWVAVAKWNCRIDSRCIFHKTIE